MVRRRSAVDIHADYSTLGELETQLGVLDKLGGPATGTAATGLPPPLPPDQSDQAHGGHGQGYLEIAGGSDVPTNAYPSTRSLLAGDELIYEEQKERRLASHTYDEVDLNPTGVGAGGAGQPPPLPPDQDDIEAALATGQADYENAHNYPAEYSALGAGTDAAHHTYATPTPRARAGSVYNGFGEKNQDQAVENSQC